MTTRRDRSSGTPAARKPADKGDALAEFDHLWETGESKRRPQRMQELLLIIGVFENAPHEVSMKGNE